MQLCACQDWAACDVAHTMRLGGSGLGILADAVVEATCWVGVSPDTASAHRLATGDAVQIASERGARYERKYRSTSPQ